MYEHNWKIKYKIKKYFKCISNIEARKKRDKVIHRATEIQRVQGEREIQTYLDT